MYNIEKKNSEIEGKKITVFVVSDESGEIITLTTDNKAAEGFVHSLNVNNVERCHVTELAEDIFYS